MARLTYAERQRLPSSAFVYPRTRRYPIEDVSHGRNAIARAHQFGSRGTIRTVERAVHRRFPEIERHNPDLVGDAMGLGLVLGVGILAFGWLKAGGSGAIGGWIQSLVPSSGDQPKQPATPSGPVATPPPVSPNAGANSFNFNPQGPDLAAVYHVNAGTLDGHAGFGHVGPGGSFVGTVQYRTLGDPFGATHGDWQSFDIPFSVGNDADWTGYNSIDFTGYQVGRFGPLGSVEVQWIIRGGSGETYTTSTDIRAEQLAV